MASQHENVYALTYRGKMFHGNSTTAAAIPVKTTTSPKFILWNPRSSGINVVLVEYVVGWAAGTNAEGNVQLGVLTDLPSTIFTGGPITAFTAGPVINGMIGQGDSYVAKFGVAATITAATRFFPLGISPMELAANGANPAIMRYRFNGSLVLTPGTAVFSCASAASVATYHERISWYEYPT